MDEFLYKNRWVIGTILVVCILGGLGVIFWQKIDGQRKTNENQEIAELKIQNDLLRKQLSEQSVAQVAGESVVEENTSDKININTASAEELDQLPNIGPARAADIIAYREQNGGFKNIEELKNIKGIGDKYFEELKDLVTVGE